MPERKSDTPTGDDPNAPAASRRSAEQNPDGLAPTSPQEAAKPTPVDLSTLCYEMTEEEKAEEKHRWKSVQAGLHPDTGKRLRPRDEKTLKATEKIAVRMQRDANMSRYGSPYPTAMDRVLRDVQEQERQRIALYGSLNPGAVELDRIRRLTDPLVDNPLLRDQLQQVQQRQQLMDAAMGGSAARAIREHMDVLAQQRRYLDPLLDRDFVRRLTGGLDDDLMYRATALHETDALRILRDKVDSAAALRITDHWRTIEQGCQHAHMLAPASAFARDGTAMATEAQRMLSVYGPTLAEQSRFLTEYWTNLGLFRIAGLTADTHERADLLARIAMPATLTAGFYGYDPFNVERVRAYGESALRQLEADFGRDGNPVHAWEARSVARRYGIDSPDWVEDLIDDTADRIMDIRDEVADGKPIEREAERVGKALGFGKDGPGQGGWFKHATMLERDRTIYFAMIDWLEEEQARHPDRRPKLTAAYREVAMVIGVDASTIQRAYVRITKLNSVSRDRSEGEGEVS
jgi:hypothetical protein